MRSTQFRTGSLSQRAMRNVFFALRPRDATLEAISAAVDVLARNNPAIGRRLKPQRLHMTLLYLDAFAAIPPGIMRHALEAGDRIDAQAFDVSLDIAGSFRNHDATWWLGCSAMPDALRDLHRKLYADMRRSGEQPRGGESLTPHVTISRANDAALETTSITPIGWRVDEVSLIDSVPGRQEFDILNTWKLRES